MDFDFTQDQQMLRDSVRRWADQTYGFEARRRIVTEGGYSPQVWAQLAQLGLTALPLPADAGGLWPDAQGEPTPHIEAMVVMEELGRAIVLEPYAHCALVSAALLRKSGALVHQQRWYEGMAQGSVRLVLAHVEPRARYDLAFCETTAAQTAQGWALTGRKLMVPAGDQVDAWIVPARIQDSTELSLFVVEHGTPGVQVHGYSTQDGSRAAQLVLESVNVPAAALLGAAHSGLAVMQYAVDVGITAQCAYAIGAMDKLLAITVEYLNTRKQFGQALSQFQVLRHRAVDMSMALELARGMSYYAHMQLEADEVTRRKAVSAAKVQVAQSATQVAQAAVQLHGGIGMTQEYIGAHYFKALTQIERSLGDAQHHLEQYVKLMD